jgi:hypothetical protein
MSDLFDDISEENESQVGKGGGEPVSGGDNLTLGEIQEQQEEEEPSVNGDTVTFPVGDADRKFGFSVEGVGANFVFAPKYYPDRFNVAKDRDIKGEADSCKGENLEFSMVENSRIHVKGIFLYNNSLPSFHSLVNHQPSKVTLYNSVLPNDAMECFIQKTQYGEQKGYDPANQDWMVSYTLDLISTGKDEPTGSDGKSGVVSEIEDEQDSIVPNDPI